MKNVSVFRNYAQIKFVVAYEDGGRFEDCGTCEYC